MNKTLLVLLVALLSSSVSAKVSSSTLSGAVVGMAAGAVVGSAVASSKNNSQSPKVNQKLKIGRTIVTCRLTDSGKCYDYGRTEYTPLQYVGDRGYRYVHNQYLVSCNSSYCLLLEVSK